MTSGFVVGTAHHHGLIPVGSSSTISSFLGWAPPTITVRSRWALPTLLSLASEISRGGLPPTASRPMQGVMHVA